MSANIAGGTATSAIWKTNAAPVAGHLGFDQLLAQARQRRRLRRLGHCPRAHEIAEVIR
jgi:hypothetical protein